MRLVFLLGWIVLLVLPARALACWGEAGQRYGVSPQILYALVALNLDRTPRPSTSRTASALARTTSG